MLKKLSLIIWMIVIFLAIPQSTIISNATQTSVNSKIVIEDTANLLTAEEERTLKNELAPLSEFGNVLFRTTKDSHEKSALNYIKDYYYNMFNDKKFIIIQNIMV